VRLDVNWAIVATVALDCRQVLPIGDAHLLVSRADHTLELLDLTDPTSSPQ